MTCKTCRAGDHEEDHHYEVAFTRATTGEPYAIPDDLKAAATRICRAYGIKGICDPM